MALPLPPFPIPHVVLQWGGKLPGNEQWSCSLRLAEQTPHIPGSNYVPPDDQYESWLTGSIKNAVLAYHQRATTAIHPRALLSFCKLNAVDINGHYTSANTHSYVFADVAGAGVAPNAFPNQIALAVSLTTGFSRGPAHRGRYYLPMPSVEIDANGVIYPQYVTGVVASTKTFLEAVADVPGIDAPNSLTPVVMSRKANAAAYRKITGVAVGQVLDTQRRRRKSLNELPVGAGLNLGEF